ncbi:hypothetical protein ACJJI4_03010 [Microbulbifer sp. TRSA002]|uniref:hypothetical protein n=1 Tax=Microbulbifer sp. TRSA002 TaxID=3243382 RepID=UPI00403918E2
MSESEMLKRLFYFGDKSKHYFQQNDKLNDSKYLKNMEDLSPASNHRIFRKLRDLRKSKNPAILEFVKRNPEFFEFFSENKNKDIFSATLVEFGTELRDYYLAILHTAGNIGLGDKSLLISTSEDINVAKTFSLGSKDYVILYFSRGRSVAGSFNQSRRAEKSVPFLERGMAIFPEQKEITYRAGLYAHNMLGVVQLNGSIFTINPHIFSEENRHVDITRESLFINQSNFEEELARCTSYTRWNYTFDYEKFYHGGEVS